MTQTANRSVKLFMAIQKKEVQKKMNATKAELDKVIFVDSAKMTVGDWPAIVK